MSQENVEVVLRLHAASAGELSTACSRNVGPTPHTAQRSLTETTKTRAVSRGSRRVSDPGRTPSRAKTEQRKEEAKHSASHGLPPMTQRCEGSQREGERRDSNLRPPGPQP